MYILWCEFTTQSQVSFQHHLSPFCPLPPPLIPFPFGKHHTVVYACFFLNPFTFSDQSPQPPALWQLFSVSMSLFLFCLLRFDTCTYLGNLRWLLFFVLKYIYLYKQALAGVAQWTECQTANQWVAGLTPNLGHMPGLRVRYPVGGTWEATIHWCFFPSLSPSLPLSLKINT